MGTNYYLRCDECKQDKQHIGKMSAGWRFLAKENLSAWQTAEDFYQYLRDHDGEIYDEYGRQQEAEYLISQIEHKKNDRENVGPSFQRRGPVDVHTGGEFF